LEEAPESAEELDFERGVAGDVVEIDAEGAFAGECALVRSIGDPFLF
jgi:hypothetical protein